MLLNLALNPCIFDPTQYSNNSLCDPLLGNLKNVLLEEALVRDLRNGDWMKYIGDNSSIWHSRAKELIKKIIRQNRTYKAESVGAQNPNSYSEWCKEAILSHETKNLNGIIAATGTVTSFSSSPVVTCIEKLHNAAWWTARSNSVRLQKKITDYLKHLDLLLKHANSFMFIDPFFDPSEANYQDFQQLLQVIARREIKPKVEFHRKESLVVAGVRKVLTPKEWENRFLPFKPILASNGMAAEVFIWDDFHDRYIISDIAGILVPHGLDVSNRASAETTWSRISRSDRDDVQKEFHPAAGRHILKGSFFI
ncbi:MAG TPA: hypothetical protein PLO78_08750 [Candidatus Omnitrophota bacterium]|nr:hypothetical protein [Candidatus Omnitrophota bacterium]